MEANKRPLLSSPPVTQDWILMTPILRLCSLPPSLSPYNPFLLIWTQRRISWICRTPTQGFSVSANNLPMKCRRHNLGQQNRSLPSWALLSAALVVMDEKNYPVWITWTYSLSFQPFFADSKSRVRICGILAADKRSGGIVLPQMRFHLCIHLVLDKHEQITWANGGQYVFAMLTNPCCLFSALPYIHYPFST